MTLDRIGPIGPGEDPATCLKFLEKLDGLKIKYELIQHKAVETAEEAAAARGVKSSEGLKAIFMKDSKGTKKYFKVGLLGNMTVDDKKVMKAMGSKRITFADLERVE